MREKKEELLTRKEVCRLLKISAVTCWSYGKKGVLTPLKIGNRVLYRRSDVSASLKPIYPSRKEVSDD